MVVKVHIISGVTLCFEKERVNKKKKGNKDGVRGGWVGVSYRVVFLYCYISRDLGLYTHTRVTTVTENPFRFTQFPPFFYLFSLPFGLLYTFVYNVSTFNTSVTNTSVLSVVTISVVTLVHCCGHLNKV